MESQLLQHVYNTIQDGRKNYGILKRCEFHLHTPASHDYNIHGKAYNRVSDEELLHICVTEGLYTPDFCHKTILELDHWRNWKTSGPEDNPYTSFKEYLAYFLLAYKLYESDIRLVVVCDHNNVEGYPKLEYALVKMYKQRYRHQREFCRPILGVEISCSDRNHLIGIFDHNEYYRVKSYLESIIHGVRKDEGTVHTSLHVIDNIVEQLRGIAYLAHVNSLTQIGTGLYKQRLFSSPNLSALGFTDLTNQTTHLQRIREWTDRISDRFCFLYEGDSHDIIEVGKKSTWVKFGHRINFSALKHAFRNHNISIYPEKPSQSDKFIKGVYVFPGRHGFLADVPPHGPSSTEKRDPFYANFSRDLNCIIGGRGTGKSTLLSVIETVMRHPEVHDKGILDFVSRHERVVIIFYHKDSDYIIDFVPQTKNPDQILNDDSDIFLERAFTDHHQSTMADHWLTLYRVTKTGMLEIKGQEKTLLLQRMYRRGYSINKLVTDIERGKIGDFIKRTVLDGVNFEQSELLLRGLRQSRKNGFKKYLRDYLSKMHEAITNRRAYVESIISDFNEANRDMLHIVYSPNAGNVDLYFKDGLESLGTRRGHVARTLLRWSDAERFVREAIKTIGFLPFLDDLYNGRFANIEKNINIGTFVSTQKGTLHVDQGLRDVSRETLKEVYQAIFDGLSANASQINDTIHEYFALSDDFGLSFNINAREHLGPQLPIIKPIEQLSLGQKVTAILTFVFKFGKHVGDNTPLIIDQPEDNLDNQYIYNTLVKSLREVKNARQVIIVTHSSTVVTNADAEQIIVMDSDNISGWILKEGAATEKHITQHILNYLEGGKPSFKHKMETYKELTGL